jgi:ABC-2 type transport system ATP-binding protein
MSILAFDNVSRRFGIKTVLKDASFQVGPGRVLGLIGKNGAGKTTLLKLAVGMLKADQGDIRIMGENAWDMPVSVKEKIGYVAQKSEHFHWMKAQELLDYTGSFFNHWDSSKVDCLMKTWEIDPKARVSELSEGQKQRLSIIQAMGHRPELLILDEPVASLDPIVRRDFIKQIIDMNIDDGTSVIFSTHIMSDLERVAADVAILQNKNIRYCGALDELQEKVVKLTIQSSSQLPDALPIKNIINESRTSNRALVTVRDFDKRDIQHLQKQLESTIEVTTLNLEDIFLELHQ